MVDLFPYGPDCTHASSIALLAMRHAESLSLHLYRFEGFVRFLDLTLLEPLRHPFSLATSKNTSFPANLASSTPCAMLSHLVNHAFFSPPQFRPLEAILVLL